MQAEHVRAPQQRLELERLGSAFADRGDRQARVVGGDAHAERRAAGGDGAGDPTEADERQRPAAQPPDCPRGPEVPAPSGRLRGERDEPTLDGEQQPDGVVGDLVDAVVGDAADGDPRGGGGLHVDVVDADPVPDDRAQGAGGAESARSDRRELHEQRVGTHRGQRRRDVLLRPAPLDEELAAGGLDDPALDGAVVSEVLVADENAHV